MPRLRPRAFPVVIAVVVPAHLAVSFVQLASTSDAPTHPLGGATPAPAVHAALRVPTIGPNDRHDTSPPLRELPSATGSTGSNGQDEWQLPHPRSSWVRWTRWSSRTSGASDRRHRDELRRGRGWPGPCGAAGHERGRRPEPPRADREHEVCVVDEQGTVLYRPGVTNALWSGFGGGSQGLRPAQRGSPAAHPVRQRSVRPLSDQFCSERRPRSAWRRNTRTPTRVGLRSAIQRR